MLHQMRMFKTFAVLTILASTLQSAPSSADSVPSAFTFTGSGYGHGVGLSQIGGRAKAIAGETSTSILSYYYPGSTIGLAEENQSLLQVASPYALILVHHSLHLVESKLQARQIL